MQHRYQAAVAWPGDPIFNTVTGWHIPETCAIRYGPRY